MSDLTHEILQAVLTAPQERKQAALRLLQGATSQPAPSAPEPFLTAKQLSAHLRVNSTTLWRWKVPGHTFCGCKRYRLSEVLAHLASPAFQARSATAIHPPRRKPPQTDRRPLTAISGFKFPVSNFASPSPPCGGANQQQPNREQTP